MSLDSDKMPVDLEEYGNTVSSTIPILIDRLRRSGQLKPGTRTVMVGFGVGLSWAGCTWTETWQQPQTAAPPEATPTGPAKSASPSTAPSPPAAAP
jgi:3-oxoacyl-[acyl-carrier-protein] synthase-3